MAIEMRVVGLDIAKNVFQLHGVDRRGEIVLRRRLRRSQVAEFFRQQVQCLIGIEATQGAQWVRFSTGTRVRTDGSLSNQNKTLWGPRTVILDKNVLVARRAKFPFAGQRFKVNYWGLKRFSRLVGPPPATETSPGPRRIAT